MELEKVYSVKFMDNDPWNVSSITKDSPLLIRESELDKYKSYGNGYRSIEFVGYMNKDIPDRED